MAVSFGVAFESGVAWGELLAVCRQLDRGSRYESVWLTDALQDPAPESPRLEAWTALAALAQATSRLRLGILISGNALRHPALVAKMATTVDHVSGGRLELGIGAGWPTPGNPYGIDFGKGWTERLERMAEAVQLIKLLWTEERPTFEGMYYRLDRPVFRPAPVQRPHPPLLVGGMSDRTLRTVARWGDAANFGGTIEQTRAWIEKLDAFCRKAGRDPSSVRKTVELYLFLHDDPSLCRRAVEAAMGRTGDSEEDVRRGSLIGSPGEVTSLLREWVETGVSEFYVYTLPEVHLNSLMRLSEEVVPAFAG